MPSKVTTKGFDPAIVPVKTNVSEGLSKVTTKGFDLTIVPVKSKVSLGGRASNHKRVRYKRDCSGETKAFLLAKTKRKNQTFVPYNPERWITRLVGR